MELQDIKINIEFENLIPKQTMEQFKQLEENILKEGRARNPLVVWKGHGILVDGHHRLRILKANPSIGYSVIEQDFADEDEVKEWIIKNALGTRNLTEADYTMLMATLYKMMSITDLILWAIAEAVKVDGYKIEIEKVGEQDGGIRQT